MRALCVLPSAVLCRTKAVLTGIVGAAANKLPGDPQSPRPTRFADELTGLLAPCTFRDPVGVPGEGPLHCRPCSLHAP